MYTSPSDLVKQFGATEIAKLSTPKRYQVIAPLLLELTVNSLDRSDYTAEEIEAADAALTVIEDAISYSEQEMDSYLAVRYPLPLSSEVILINPLKGRCNDISRYRLARSHPSDEIERRYQDAIAWLRELAKGNAEIVQQVSEENGEIENLSPQKIQVGHYQASWEDSF